MYRHEASGDHAGIHRTSNMLGDEVQVRFVPNGRQGARIEAAAGRLTHDQIAEVWTRMKLADGRPMQASRFPPGPSRRDGAAVVFTFTDNDGVCVDFRTQLDGSIVTARHC